MCNYVWGRSGVGNDGTIAFDVSKNECPFLLSLGKQLLILSTYHIGVYFTGLKFHKFVTCEIYPLYYTITFVKSSLC